MRVSRLALAVCCMVLSTPMLAQQPGGDAGFDVAPPPPPAGGQNALPPAAPMPVQTPEAAVASRYQTCFQRMVDAGINDNGFMKKCMGLPQRGQAKKGRPAPPLGTVDASNRPEWMGPIQQNLSGLKDCYDNLLMQSKDLGLLPSGMVGAFIEVQPSGQTQVLAIDPQSLPDMNLLACFRARLRAWVFPKQAARTGVYVSFRLSAKSPQKGQVAISRGFPQLAAPAMAPLPTPPAIDPRARPGK